MVMGYTTYEMERGHKLNDLKSELERRIDEFFKEDFDYPDNCPDLEPIEKQAIKESRKDFLRLAEGSDYLEISDEVITNTIHGFIRGYLLANGIGHC